jgi:hypothetical protein
MKTPYIILIILVSFAGGFFAGREHLKYELEASISAVGSAINESLKETFSTNNSVKTKDASLSNSGSLVKNLKIGEIFSASTFNFQLEKISVDFITVNSFIGPKKSDEKFLLLSFNLANSDPRKILEYFEHDDTYCLADDVGNKIDPKHINLTDNVDGVTRYEKINPEQKLKFIKIFNLPLPKTESLLLTVDLKNLKSEEKLNIAVPIEMVEGFKD